MISEALKNNTSLKNLDLSGNNIGDDGAKAIAEALKKNTSLKSVNLSWCDIGDDGIEAIAEALLDPKCGVQEVIMGSYDFTSYIKQREERIRQDAKPNEESIILDSVAGKQAQAEKQ